MTSNAYLGSFLPPQRTQVDMTSPPLIWGPSKLPTTGWRRPWTRICFSQPPIVGLGSGCWVSGCTRHCRPTQPPSRITRTKRASLLCEMYWPDWSIHKWRRILFISAMITFSSVTNQNLIRYLWNFEFQFIRQLSYRYCRWQIICQSIRYYIWCCNRSLLTFFIANKVHNLKLHLEHIEKETIT